MPPYRTKISVIIPTYKPKEYIEKCLFAVMEQTIEKNDFEVIIVLNGCNEPWNSQLQKFITDNCSSYHFNLLQIDEAGVSHARNVGMDNADGEYIAFIDDDDIISPKYLEELYNNSSQTQVAMSNVIGVDYETQKQDRTLIFHKEFMRLTQSDQLSFFNTRRLLNAPWGKLIHRTIIGRNRFDEKVSIGEDALFNFLISRNIKTLALTSKYAIYYYQYRPNSAYNISKTYLYWIENWGRLMVRYCRIFVSAPLQYSFCFFLSRLLAIAKTHLLKMMQR